MKPITKLIGILLLLALLCSTASAATENKEMPTEKEVTAFIDGLKVTDVNSIYDAFIEQYPAGHCDIWNENTISLYFYVPDSARDYGSIYLDSTGKEVKAGCGIDAPIKSYKGESVSEVKEEVKEEIKEEPVKEVTVKEEVKDEHVKEVIKEEIKEEPVEEEVKEETAKSTGTEIVKDGVDKELESMSKEDKISLIQKLINSLLG